MWRILAPLMVPPMLFGGVVLVDEVQFYARSELVSGIVERISFQPEPCELPSTKYKPGEMGVCATFSAHVGYEADGHQVHVLPAGYSVGSNNLELAGYRQGEVVLLRIDPTDPARVEVSSAMGSFGIPVGLIFGPLLFGIAAYWLTAGSPGRSVARDAVEREEPVGVVGR